jgi:hypothetical protein
MQQDLEDKKNEIIVEGLEGKIKEKKDFDAKLEAEVAKSLGRDC